MSTISARQRTVSHASKISFSPKQHRPSVIAGRSRIGSISTLLWGARASVAFRTGKSGFKVPRYQNTYQLESNNRFSYVVVDKILETVMTEHLTGIKYHPIECLKLCQVVAAEIRKRIFKKDYDRYKYVVLLTIIEKKGQGINVGLGYVWDAERDAYCKYVFESPQFYAYGIVIGVYYE